jgi:hypothetical protein
VKTLVLALFLSTSIACHPQEHKEKNMVLSEPTWEIPFEYAGTHLLKVPVVVNEQSTHFIFDTGIGVNLLSKSKCVEFGCKITGQQKGRRMSGQELVVPMSTVDELQFGPVSLKSTPVGVWEMKGFLTEGEGLRDVHGFLSLNAIADAPLTIDYTRMKMIFETMQSLAFRRNNGHVIPIELKRNGESLTTFMRLSLPNGDPISVEIDLGGNILTLNASLMDRLKISKTAEDLRIENAIDETDFAYRRYFTKMAGPIYPDSLPGLGQEDLGVMFQNIIYDGLIGNSFMKRFIVTYNLQDSEIILSPREK